MSFVGVDVRADEAGPSILMRNCHFVGPDLIIDLAFVRDVEGLERVEIRDVRFGGGVYGRREFLSLLEGRREAVIKGCRICRLPISGDDGSSDVCQDDLLVRCVMSA